MYIQRTIHDRVKNHLKRKEYTIITGPRQCGKTSLMLALFEELQNSGESVSFITFEDRDILTAINNHPEEVFSFSRRPEKPRNLKELVKHPHFLFIDEMQNASDPSNFLKYLYDVYGENLKIVATGSSAFYIDRKFTDSLAGRKRVFELKTLSFKEYLKFKEKTVFYKEMDLIRKQAGYVSSHMRELMGEFNNYLVYGGYPEVVLEENNGEKINLLKEIKNSFLKRDVDESGISNPDKFYNLLALLAGQAGNLVNRNELSNTIGVDHKTTDKYLYVLQNCFHLDLVKPFYSNLRKELTKMPKIYFKDFGLRNMALNRFFEFRSREDQGALLENYIYLRLIELYDTEQINFWRISENKEIDFIVTTSFGEGVAYEAKMKCKSVKKSASKSFLEHYPNYPVKIISFESDSECKWVLSL
jgi:predicted AAA+ superfamily ATPase